MKCQVAIAIPSRDEVKAEFAFALAELTAYLKGRGTSYVLLNKKSSLIQEGRHILALQAIQQAEQTLWLDSDIVFPPNVYYILNKHNAAIVSGNYKIRNESNRSVAKIQHLYGLHQIDETGMGCMLVDNNIMEKLELPWFDVGYENGHYIGEDINFCRKVKAAGYDILLDANLKLEHIGYKAYK